MFVADPQPQTPGKDYPNHCHSERSSEPALRVGTQSKNPVASHRTPEPLNTYWVYMLTNAPRNTVLYTGVTNSLEVRVWQHQQPAARGFAWRYSAHTLAYFESFTDPSSAIAREKQLKAWRREKKNALIAVLNSEWRDLAAELFDAGANGQPRGPSTAFAEPHSAQDDRRLEESSSPPRTDPP